MAELPRYRGGAKPQTGGTELIREQGAMFGDLSSRIDSYAGEAVRKYGQEAQMEGKIEGLRAGATGKIEPQDKLTIYGNAYNTSAQTAYTAQTGVAAKNKALEYAAIYQNNPAEFKAAYEAYAKTTISAAPTEEINYIMKNQFDTYGGTAYTKLLVDKQTNIRTNEKKSYEGYASVLSEDYRASILAGDEEVATETLTNLIALQQSAVQNGFVSNGEIAQYNRNLMSEGYKDKVLATFDGSPEAISEFKKGEHTLLTLEDKQEVMKKMLNQIRDENAIVKNQEEKESAFEEALRKETVMDFTGLMLSNELTQTDIDAEYRVGNLNRADYNYFSEQISLKGVKYDNTDEVLRITAYPADFSKEDIYNNPNITNETKRKLIADQARYLEAEGKWTGTIEGTEARARVKRHFGILSDTLMAQMDFTGQNAKDFDKTYRSFYDKVMALPPEERAIKSLQLADEAIFEYNGIITQRKEMSSSRREEQKKQKEQAKIDAYKDSVTGKFMNTLGSFGIFEGDPDALD